ncbi:soluble NSF attachment family protein [Apibacter raozihei]|uniref:tetratricopeptide repeat protein n=1 Tax=Apibacter raozihei TaxID=2500547 RepID=UPI001E51873F|nr:soluble NSF attachment family protein [Apibacter raozihei]
MMKNKQNFIDKFYSAIFILGILKLVGILSKIVDFSVKSIIVELVIFFVIMFIILSIISRLKRKNNNNTNYSTDNTNTAAINSSNFNKIKNKYEQIAKNYIKSKEYKKAAKVYSKLLNNNYKAAKVLKEGKLYSEAAIIYLKLLKDKKAAAQCYVMAFQYHSAISLYRELKEYEKVGDLYIAIHDVNSANNYYQMVINNYIQNNQFVKASLIYSKKMNDCDSAQKILLDGWNKNLDAYNCLIIYLNNYTDSFKLKEEIERLYFLVLPNQKLIFLKVLKKLFTKNKELQTLIKNMAYEIIADKINSHPMVVNELQYFNPQDTFIRKDIIRYKTGNNKIFTG